jgi:hypothetical protein
VRPVSRIGALLVLALGLAATSAAEVMDKMPTTEEMWLTALLLGITAGTLAWLHPALLLAVIPMAVIGPADAPLTALSELYHPHVGPAVAREAGWTYIASVYATNALWPCGGLIGALYWRRVRKHESKQPPAAGPTESTGP